MQNEKYLELDALAAPNGYVAPPMKEDLAYVVHFRKTCQRYQIDFTHFVAAPPKIAIADVGLRFCFPNLAVDP